MQALVSKPARSRVLTALFICLGSVLILTHSGVVGHFEQTSGLSWLFHWRQAVTPPEQVVIISINQQAASNLNLPQHLIRWNRKTYAKLIDLLNNAGADTIVFDIAFIEARPEQDQYLAQAIRAHGKVVLFNYMKRQQTPSGNGAYLDIETPIPPPELLRSAALNFASFTLPKFPAQIVSTQLWREHDGSSSIAQPLLTMLSYYEHLLPTLAHLVDNAGGPESLSTPPPSKQLDVYASALHQLLHRNPAFYSRLRHAIDNETHTIPLSRLLDAIYHADSHTINFYGPPGTVPTFTIDQVLLEPDRLHKRFSKKIVYIGLAETAQTEQQDAYRTVFTRPTGVDLSGVEISATVLANLLQGTRLKPAGHWAESLILLFATLYATVAFLRTTLHTGISIVLTGAIVYGLVAYWLFTRFYIWVPLASPVAAAMLGTTLALYIKSVILKTRQHNVQQALAKYLPEEIADKLSYNVSALEQQRQLVQGVCLMTDIHGFTRVSEQLSPSDLHDRLNRYYSKLIEVVSRHDGAVANIVGDSLLAVWTTDKLDKNICEQALNSAREMLEILHQTEKHEDSFPTSVALHCGEFSIGHLGAANHFEYSPVGDIVNTTSRIEQLNRDLQTQVLCSGSFVAVRGKNGMRYRGDFELKNKQKPLSIYEFCTH